jgi:hypothetical protein
MLLNVDIYDEKKWNCRKHCLFLTGANIDFIENLRVVTIISIKLLVFANSLKNTTILIISEKGGTEVETKIRGDKVHFGSIRTCLND